MRKLITIAGLLLFAKASPVNNVTNHIPIVILPEITITPTEEDKIYDLTKALIKKYEGKRYKAYWDYKQYSNGYGCKSAKGEVWSEERINREFTKEYHKSIAYVEKYWPHLKGHKKYAIVMMVYNLKPYQILKSKQTSKLLSQGKKPPFHLWINAGGEPSDGLIKRRKAEEKLWYGKYNFNYKKKSS